MNIAQDLVFDADHPAILKIRNTDTYSYFVVGLEQGQVMKKHVTHTPATLVVLRGQVEMVIGDHWQVLREHDVFDIPVDQQHEVIGLERCMFSILKEK